MASRKPNMLEAFQDSARAAQRASVEEQKAAARTAPGDSPEPATPEAKREPGSTALPPTSSTHGMEFFGEDVLGTRPRSARGIPVWMPVAIVVLICAMAGTYWVTRELGREARADGGSSSVPIDDQTASDLRALSDGAESTEPSTTPGPAIESDTIEEAAPVNQQLTADDVSFLDTQNRFTVRAIQFPGDSKGRVLAMQAYTYLREAGLPAVVPLTMKNDLVICVGAEPKQAGRLAEIRTKLQALPGPPPQNEPGAFSGAYDVNISDYIDR